MATRFACTLCGHAQDEHNLIVGCPHCQCAATPSEARRAGWRNYEGRVLEPTEYLHEWQRPGPPEPVPVVYTKYVVQHRTGDVWVDVVTFDVDERDLARERRDKHRERYAAASQDVRLIARHVREDVIESEAGQPDETR